MLQIVIGKSHPELGFFDARNMLDDRLHLFMVEAIAVHGADPFGEVENPPGGEWRRFDKLAVLPVTTDRGHFAYVDLRVEVGGKRLAVTTGVGIDNVELFNNIEIFLRGQSRIDIGDPRIEAGAEQRHQSGVLETLLIGPLPGVFKMSSIERLIIGGIKVIDAGLKAGVHDVQILIG